MQAEFEVFGRMKWFHVSMFAENQACKSSVFEILLRFLGLFSRNDGGSVQAKENIPVLPR